MTVVAYFALIDIYNKQREFTNCYKLLQTYIILLLQTLPSDWLIELLTVYW